MVMSFFRRSDDSGLGRIEAQVPHGDRRPTHV